MSLQFTSDLAQDIPKMASINHLNNYSYQSIRDNLSENSDVISIGSSGSSEEIDRHTDEDTDSAFSSGDDCESIDYVVDDRLAFHHNTTIVKGILAYMSNTNIQEPLVDNWRNFCPDALCVYKTISCPYDKMTKGSFFEENGVATELDENTILIEDDLWKRDDEEDHEDTMKGEEELFEKSSSVGVIGDRDTKKVLRRTGDEVKLVAKEEALARITVN